MLKKLFKRNATKEDEVITVADAIKYLQEYSEKCLKRNQEELDKLDK